MENSRLMTANTRDTSSFIQLSLHNGAIHGLPVTLVVGRFTRAKFEHRDFAHYFADLDEAENWCPKRRQDYLAGRLCAAAASQGTVALSHLAPQGIGRHADGRPAWHRDITGSISHSGELALAVVTGAGEGVCLGTDVEFKVGQKQAQGLGRFVLSETEKEVVRASGLNFSLAVTLVFSAKETLFKAFSEPGERLSFTRARLVGIDIGQQALQFVADGENGYPALHTVLFALILDAKKSSDSPLRQLAVATLYLAANK